MKKYLNTMINNNIMKKNLNFIMAFFMLLIISLGSAESISRSIESISANLLNNTALPSITGFDAREPKLPRPNIADPLLMTATKLPLVVYS